MIIINHPSPNHGPRREGAAIDMLVLHYTDMATPEEALERLCDPAAEVSAHYLIAEDGRIWNLVEEARRAWHAGVSYWAGERDVNARSIGIELANPGHRLGYIAFPEAQMAALEALALEILSRHPIPPHRVLGHSDVSPARKRDPGELFDWRRLAAAGIGVWVEVDEARAGDPVADWDAFQRDLVIFGYEIEAASDMVRAFHRHFRPSALEATADALSADLVTGLIAAMGR